MVEVHSREYVEFVVDIVRIYPHLGCKQLSGLTNIAVSRDDWISRWKTSTFPIEDVILNNMQRR